MKQETRNTASPLISVIVPIYNAEQTLRQCVDSILMQEYKDFELLLIDDGSKDSSPKMCDEYAAKDDRVKVFHKENGGVSSARNLGLDHARGEWITFVDSDDYITEGYFEGVDGRNEDILFLGYKTLYHGKLVKNICIPKEYCFHPFLDLISTNINNTIIRGPVAKYYRRNIVSSSRFNPIMNVGEDVCFVFGYLAQCNSYYVLNKAEYIVVYCGIPDEKKYSLNVTQAAISLLFIKSEFGKVVEKHGINKSLLLHYINYFKRISKSDWQQDKSKWYNNPNVKALYGYVWPALSVKQKVRLIASRMLRD